MSATQNTNEIVEILKRKLQSWQGGQEEYRIGRVVESGDGIAQVWGLRDAMAGELVDIETEDGSLVPAMVMNLEEDTLGLVIFRDAHLVKEGQIVTRRGTVAQVPAGPGLAGRVLDPFGTPLDGRGGVEAAAWQPVEAKAPGINDRENVRQALQTGIKAIDAMVPIGRGQRELIIGDRRTGKTTIALDTIINQKQAAGTGQVHCFYVAIGQKRSSVVQLVDTLTQQGVMGYTTVVAATASDSAALQYLAPYAACAMAEYWRDNGGHALVVYDDLTKHSQAWRELSLLMRRSPGREAYPGDIFYLHSRLLERAAKMSSAQGGGSLTALPIVETQEGEVSAYIPTNVISITDGQIFLEADLFNSGLRPAINVGVSVSRVGGDAQIKLMKQVASSLRIDLAQFRELAAFMQFSSDLDQSTRAQLARGERLTEILKQGQYRPVEVLKQVLILRCGSTGRLDKYPVASLQSYQEELFDWIDAQGGELLDLMQQEGSFTPAVVAAFQTALDRFESGFRPGAAAQNIDAGYTLNLAMAMSHRGGGGINKEMLTLVERLTARELATPDLQEEIQEIMTGKDISERDRLKELVARCPVVDFKRSTKLEPFIHDMARLMEKRLSGRLGAEKIFEMYMERERTSSTALQPYFAIPHIIVEGQGVFELIMVRSRRGIEFSEKAPQVHTVFVLAGSMDQRHFHLVVLAALAQLVKSQDFAQKWMDIRKPEDLRKLFAEMGKK